MAKHTLRTANSMFAKPEPKPIDFPMKTEVAQLKPRNLSNFRKDYKRFVSMHDDLTLRHRAVRNLISTYYLHIGAECTAWLAAKKNVTL